MEKKKSEQLMLNVFFILLGCFCYYMASKFNVTKSADRIGPDFWPKVMCLIVIIFSAADVVILLMNKEKKEIEAQVTPTEDTAVTNAVEYDVLGQKYPLLLVGGIIGTAVYIYLQPIIGFILSTLLYLAGIMVLGRYRNRKVIIISSFVGAAMIFLIFCKIVYINLPSGTGFMGNFTFMLYQLLGVH